MLVYDLLDGGLMFVECGGERGSVATLLWFVIQEVGPGGCGGLLFQVLGVDPWVPSLVEPVFQGCHRFGGISWGGADFTSSTKLSVGNVVHLFGGWGWYERKWR